MMMMIKLPILVCNEKLENEFSLPQQIKS